MYWQDVLVEDMDPAFHMLQVCLSILKKKNHKHRAILIWAAMFSVDAQEWLGTEKLWEYLSSELKGASEGINAVISHVLKKQWRIWFGSSTYSINIIEVLWRSLKDTGFVAIQIGIHVFGSTFFSG